MREPSDIRGVPRFSPNPSRPEHLVDSIVALSEQTNRLALESAMEAAHADSLGKVTHVVEQVCRLAVGAGVAAGEISWLVSELESSHPADDQLAEAAVAVSGMQSCMSAVSTPSARSPTAAARRRSARRPTPCAASRPSSKAC